MNGLSERLGVRAGEGRLVSMVLAYGFCLGFGRLFSGAAVSGMFLDTWGARALPYSFIGTALVVPVTGLAYLRARGRMPLARLIAIAIGLLVVVILGFRLALSFGQPAWLVMTLMIGYTTVYVLVSLSFWGLTGQLFNVRQGKRLFGLLSTGSEVADICGGLLTLVLAPLIGSPNLLLLASASLLAALLVERAIVRRHPLGADAEDADGAGRETPAVGATLAGTYVRLLLVLVALSQIGYFFVENIFYELSMAHFSGPSQYSALVGATVAASSILTIILQVTAVGPLIGRLGVRGGLPVLPALLLVGAAAVAISGTLLGGVLAVFVLMLITRVTERALRFSIDETAVQIAYQPLPAAQRSLLQTLVDGGVKPLAAGVAGILILVCTRLLGFGSVELAALLALLALAWAAVAVALGRGYRGALLSALGRRRLSGLSLRADDSDSLAIISRGLRSPHAGEALYALQLIEELEHASLPSALAALLDHPEASVRQEALRRIERGQGGAMGQPVAALLSREGDPAARGQALRTLGALGAAPAALLDAALADPAPEVRLGAAVALARQGGAAALQPRVEAWARSADPAERSLAAQAIGAAGAPAGGQLLRPLLADESRAVRKAALAAVAGAGAGALWPEVVSALGSAALRPAATASLIAGGAPAREALGDALGRAELPIGLRLQVARALGKTGAAAGPILLARLADPAEELRHGVALALAQSGYRAGTPEDERLGGHIRAEAQAAAWALAARRDIGAAPAGEPLCAALDGAVRRSRERILALLAALAGPQMIQRVRAGLAQTAEQQAYAVEALDLLLTPELRPVVLPLMEDQGPAQALAALERRFPQQRLSAEQRIAEILAGDPARHNPWVYACAQAAARRADEPPEQPLASSLFERVQLLKGSAIFRAVPEEELLAVAALLQPEQFSAGDTIFTQGEPGSCAYIVASGRVRVHNSQRTLNELGAREIVGELAVLDARPRSLSATALEPTQLLRLDRDPFFELLADHVAVARAIIGVLIRNLRGNVRELGALELQLQRVLEAAPATHSA